MEEFAVLELVRHHRVSSSYHLNRHQYFPIEFISAADAQNNGNTSLNDNNVKQSEQTKPKQEILNDIRNSLDKDQLEKLKITIEVS